MGSETFRAFRRPAGSADGHRLSATALTRRAAPMRVAALLALTATAALTATPALAARGHVFKSTFSGPCAAEPCAGLLKEPSGVAVNESTGDVYVVDREEAGQHGRVARFTAAGVYVSEFNGSGTVEVGGIPIEGKAAGSGGLAGEIATGRFEEPEGIAVDNSCVLQKLSEPECKAKDPSNGDVYVVDAGSAHRVVDKYSPAGEYLGQITEAEGVKFQATGALDGVAVDPEGKVWVYREEPILDGFSNGTPNEFVPPAISLAGQGLGFAPRGSGVAVDSTGAFYVGGSSVAGSSVAKVSRSGEVLIQEVDGQPSSAVAVNQVTDQSLIDNLTTIRVSEPDGTEAERLGEEAGVKHLVKGAGVGVNAGAGSSVGAGSVYVADAATGHVVVFGLTEPQAPSVAEESVSGVSADSAVLGAEVNPRSEPGEPATEYHFQYGPCLNASKCAESPYPSETPAGTLAPDFQAHPVSAPVGGLTAGTTYHFRALASNTHGQATPGPEQLFTTQSAGGPLLLPDNRGWELVSPPDKLGALIEPIAEEGVVQAAADGSAITYLTNSPTEPEPEGYANLVQVLSRRATASWSSRDIAIPHAAAAGKDVGPGVEYKFFNPALTQSAVQPAGQFNPALSPEASESTAYLHDLTGACGASCFRPLVTGKPGFSNVPENTVFGEAELCNGTPGHLQTCGPRFEGATEDLTHVVLFSQAPLTPGAGLGQLYEWSAAALAHVSVLPKGEPAPEDAHLGLHSHAARGAISSDGSRIEFETPFGLYQRDMAPPASTVQLDAAKCGAPEGCESGGGQFQFASSEGTRVFFTDQHKLTVDAGASPPTGHAGKADLYECHIVPAGEAQRCDLTDLTPKHGTESAEVQGDPSSEGAILGASADGEYVYFVANGVQSETPNGRGQSPQPGHPNLYLRHGAGTTFIATLAPGDATDWQESLFAQPTRVSPNGRYLELMSEARLTGYDNRDVATSKPAAEVYLYDATANALVCASCDPTGARPVGVEYHKLEPGSGGLVGGPGGTWSDKALVAANVPGWTDTASGLQTEAERYQPRYLSDSGRLFFNTVNALVAQDSNNTQDVYEYEPLALRNTEGKSVCESSNPTFSAASGGCVALISSGESSQESAFMDASESGDDVFFLTSAKLSKLDTDTARDIYDAHVCTGAQPCIAFTPTETQPCATESSCKSPSPPQPSIFGAPASATFQGPGNLTPAAPPPPVKPTAAQLKAKKLTTALASCRKRYKHSKKRRATCEKQAKKKYGPVKARKSSRKGKR